MADISLKDRQDIPIWNALEANNMKQALKLVDKRLAKKRTEHLEAFKIYIRSRSPLPSEKSVILLVIEELVEKKTALSDLEDIDLYDEALENVLPEPSQNWADLIGELRWQSVKAFPKGQELSLKCFQACLTHDDWEHAQQIASILEKNYPKDHKYVFWNVTALYLRSTSANLPVDKKSLWGRLALSQVGKLATATKQMKGSKSLLVRSIQTPQELLLLHRITAAYGKVEDRLSYLQDPWLGPESAVAKGDWELWIEKLQLMAKSQKWQELFDLTATLLQRARSKDKSGQIVEPRMADWAVWDAYLKSAIALQRPRWTDEASLEVAAHLDPASGVDKAWRRNASLAWLKITFENASASFISDVPAKSVHDGENMPSTIAAISRYFQQFGDAATGFSDLRPFAMQLNSDERKLLLRVLRVATDDREADCQLNVKEVKVLALDQDLKTPNGITRRVNSYKLAYLLSSSLAEHERYKSPMYKSDDISFTCVWCSKQCSLYCRFCLASLTHDSVMAYKSAIDDDGRITKALLPTDRHPADNFAILAAMCLIKLSKGSGKSHIKSIADPRIAHLLQATVLLEYGWARSNPNFQISLLLVRLYSSLGCGSLALKAFQRLGLKQIQQDTLSYILFDRISSLHLHPFPPSHDAPLKHRGPLEFLQKQQKIYKIARSQVAHCTWMAFEHGNYNSIFQFKEFSETISRTISAATSVVESRRISRISKKESTGGYEVLPPNPECLDTFPDTNDYDTFPNFESTESQSFENLSRFAPGPSTVRCRLNLIIERLMQLLEPYSITEAQRSGEVTWFKERLHPTFKSLLQQVSSNRANPDLTEPERSAMEGYDLIAGIVLDACDSERWPEPDSRNDLDANNRLLCERLDEQSSLLDSIQTLTPAVWGTLHVLCTAYELGCAVLKLTKFLSQQATGVVHESQTSSNKKLFEKAQKLLQAVGEKSKAVTVRMEESGWIDKVIESVLQSDGDDGSKNVQKSLTDPLKRVIDENFMEEWAGNVVESWRDSVVGLSYVKST